MDNSSEVIRHEMEETRSALQEKLETLENQVKETVQETTQAVTGTVEAVKETVEAVKESVEETVDTVKDTVSDTVQSVKQSLDLHRLTRDHPYTMFACATALGFVGGKLLISMSRPSVVQYRDQFAAPVPFSAASSYNGQNGRETDSLAEEREEPVPAPRRGLWSFIKEHYGSEIDKLKGLAMATVGSLAAEMITEKATPEVGRRAKEIIDNVVSKLGGEPLHEPIVQPEPQRPEGNGTRTRGMQKEAFAT